MVVVDLYRDEYWEVHDPERGRIIAHFFDAKEAQDYVDWVRHGRKTAS